MAVWESLSKIFDTNFHAFVPGGFLSRPSFYSFSYEFSPDGSLAAFYVIFFGIKTDLGAFIIRIIF